MDNNNASLRGMLSALCSTVEATGGSSGMDPNGFAHSLNDLVPRLDHRNHHGNDNDDGKNISSVFQRLVDMIVSIQSKVSVLEADNDACLNDLARSSLTNRALTRRLAKCVGEKKTLRAALKDSIVKSSMLQDKIVHLTQTKRLLIREVKRLTADAKACQKCQQEWQLYVHERFLLDPIPTTPQPPRMRKDTADSSNMSTIGSMTEDDDDDVVFDQEDFGNQLGRRNADDSVAAATSSYILQLDGEQHVRETCWSLNSLSGLLDPDIQRMEDELLLFDGDDDDDESSRPLNHRGGQNQQLPQQQGFLRKMAQMNPFDRRSKDERSAGPEDHQDGGEDSATTVPDLQALKCDSGGDGSTVSVKFPRWLFLAKIGGGDGKIGKGNGGSDQQAEDHCPLITAADKSRGGAANRSFWLPDKLTFLQHGDTDTLNETPSSTNDSGMAMGATGGNDDNSGQQIHKAEPDHAFLFGMTPFAARL